MNFFYGNSTSNSKIVHTPITKPQPPYGSEQDTYSPAPAVSKPASSPAPAVSKPAPSATVDAAIAPMPVKEFMADKHFLPSYLAEKIGKTVRIDISGRQDFVGTLKNVGADYIVVDANGSDMVCPLAHVMSVALVR